MKSDQKAKGNNGCLQGCGCLTLVFILLALASPRLVGVKDTCSNCAVRNGLVTVIKECLVREANNQPTNFSDVQSFSNPKAYSGYVLKPSSDPELKDTCFGARAEPIDPTYLTWFELNHKNDVPTMTCGDSSKPGCDEGNKW
tara:strand:- start:130 stop:555 length:426 start_codon:yes stop_codon:yes gene_type:complete